MTVGYKLNGNTRSGNVHVAEMSSAAKTSAAILNSSASVARMQSQDTSLTLPSLISKGWDWITGGWGNLLGGGQTGYNPTTFSSSGFTSGARTVSGSDFKKSGGLGSLFTSLLGGGTGISLGGIISGIGNYFTEKSKAKIDMRRLDIQESLGKESNAINRLIAEGNIAENKRRTAIQSTFMGWTNPIAQVEGVNAQPGLTVAESIVPQEVNKTAGGALGTSNNGLITQAQQRRVA